MSAAALEVAPVRPGEEIDAAKLAAYLRGVLDADTFAPTGEVQVAQFPHGHSNLTYLITDAQGHSFVLRRPPLGHAGGSAHDMAREWRVMSGLHGHFAPLPRPLHLCEDTAVVGAPFYLTDVLVGTIYRKKLPPGRVLKTSDATALCNALVDTLATLHALDTTATALRDLGRPEGYVQRQVEGWSRRYDKAQTDEIADLDRARIWLASHLPDSAEVALLHNDYKFDNVVFAADAGDAPCTDIIGVLDWEMSTRGDPLMDVGTVLSYWVEAGDPPAMQAARFGPTHLPGALTRQGVVRRYAERTGRNPDALEADIVFYYVFGLVKTAVVTQQIYARFAAGKTQDPRFGAMLQMTQLLAGRAARVIDEGTLA